MFTHFAQASKEPSVAGGKQRAQFLVVHVTLRGTTHPGHILVNLAPGLAKVFH
jgi:hypothetical protein